MGRICPLSRADLARIATEHVARALLLVADMITRRSRGRLAPAITALVSFTLHAGCALNTVGGSFTATRPFTPKPHTAGDVALHFVGDDRPACPLTRVGVITYNGNKTGQWAWGRRMEATDAEALEGLRAYIASRGLDGALEVRCGGSGTTGYGTCEGLGFVCTP